MRGLSMTQNEHYTDGAAEVNQRTQTQCTGGSMAQLNIYQCAVEKKNRKYGANVFVLGRSFTQVEQALISDPDIKLLETRLFGEEGAVLTDRGEARLYGERGTLHGHSKGGRRWVPGPEHCRPD
jgi:hypothetical protein